MNPDKDVLHVRMLTDNFCVYVKEDSAVNEIFTSPMLRNRSLKMLQLLAYLLYFHDNPVERARLLSILYGPDYDETAENNLRALVFRLRKVLEKLGLPPGDYILNQKGVYRWNEEAIRLDIDAEDFQKQTAAALALEDETEKGDALKQALSLYQQDFLKLFENEPWVVHEANQYRLLFTRALGELCRILKEQENYQELIALTAKAIQAFPDEQWFIFQIEAFLALNQFDRAYQTYEYAVKVLVDDMDLTPSDRLRDVFRGLNKKVDKSLETIKEIRDKLQDTIEPGRAYYCTFPSFIDAYRLSGRIMKRSRIPSFLILCTLTDSRGEKITDKKKLEKVSAQLKDTLMTSVRSSDMLTQYNMSQYLLLLNGIVREDCSIVTSRISRSFKKQNPSPNYFVNFYVSSVLDAPPISIITVDGQGK